MRLLIVPRWGGTEDSDFYPWLRERVATRFDTIATASLQPSPDEPQIEACIAALASLLDDPSPTLMLSHSIGNHVVMRTLARRSMPVLGCLMVAGWYDLDERWPSIQSWVDGPIDDTRARATAGCVEVLISTNDRFTTDYAGTRAAFESRMDATVHLIEGRDHFNASEQPEVLAHLEALQTRLAG